VVPRADRDAISVDESGQLRVRVHAAPADGAANEAVIRLLAEALGIPKSALHIASGTTARTKIIACQGLGQDEAMERIRANAESNEHKRRGRSQ